MLTGEIRHKDTLGNSGSIGAGDVQWMTAGHGILHEEMPQVRPEGIAGFQLWVNLPAKVKMMKPRYQEVRARDIPEIKKKDGSVVRLIAGQLDGVSGPVTEIAANPFYADVSMPAESSFTLSIPKGHTAFAYLFEGAAAFSPGSEMISHAHLIVWEDGDSVQVTTGKSPARFLLVSGKPLHEPIARYGPFVMTTQEEIEKTLQELRDGTFI
jgi:redox-sensitive bicupin YhaK (pirin superfamily)